MRINQLMPGIVAVTLLIQGCVTQMNPDADQVRLIQDPDAHNCKFLGMVTGSARFGWNLAHKLEGALNEIMNKAAEKGANAIYLSDSDSGTAGSAAIAGAYYCEFE